MKRLGLKFITRIIFGCLLVAAFGFWLRQNFNQELLADSANLGWFVGVFGTLYTLIAAFIIVQVWSQFNNMSRLLGLEAKAVCALWDFTDYLNDAPVSRKMSRALDLYLKTVVGREKEEASRGVKSVHPSKELTAILQVIDSIKFDDRRDAAIFPSLIEQYEALSSVRMERIENGVTRVPLLLKLFFMILSVGLILSFALLGFNSNWLYYFSLITITFILGFAYLMAIDLDNPFDGFWNIDYVPLENAKRYLKQ